MFKKTAVLAGLVAAVLLAGAAAGPAQAAKPEPISATTYTALGDSFAAGYGAGDPILLGQVPTGQFTGAYPLVLASGPDLTFLAFPGATTSDIHAQIDWMPPSTRQVTLTVGGNDLGFVEKLTTCAHPAVPCTLTHDDAEMLAALPGDLAAVIDAIHEQAKDAKIYVTGYPLLFQASSDQCVVGTVNGLAYDVGETKANQLDAVAIALNTAIKSAIVGSVHRYAKYVDVTAAFSGHGLCGSDWSINADSYINPVRGTYTPETGLEVDLTNGPLHPSVDGQKAFAQSILAKGFKR